MSAIVHRPFTANPRRNPNTLTSYARRKIFAAPFGSRNRGRRSLTVVATQGSDSQQQQDLNISVLRFTFGIPGFDESYLPRYLGLGFGTLIVVNHFFSSSVSPAQLRSEGLGIFLAAFSTVLPYLGRFLKGAIPVDRAPVPEGSKQIFIMSETDSASLKEDLAWASYVLLRNTNTISVLIVVESAMCIRGCWNTPEGISKDQIVEWFRSQIDLSGLFNLNDALYFPQSSDENFGISLPAGSASLLVQPIFNTLGQATGFILLISSSKYAYGEKDRAWVRAVSNKFRSVEIPRDAQNCEDSL